ncbi:MAG TPA: heavy metal translocating P-type ATPase, partial [Anaerolineae bacterium]|nr:heavy metal translocating P-type ATPase [Anaerolineae bacterium]
MEGHSQHEHEGHTAQQHGEHQQRTGQGHQGHEGHSANGGDHQRHTDHSGHEQMFRRRFWISLLLSIPVLVFSPALQDFLGYTAPQFPGSQWVTPLFSAIVFVYGGIPFLRMAIPELRNRQPGMMTLISMAILVAFGYSLATLFVRVGKSFFWELVTLIDVMLLGHWIEMRSVRQASGALDELAKLMPDTAERIRDDGQVEEVPISELKQGDRVLVRPGASVPADGEVEEGDSSVNEAMITGESKPVDKEPGDEVIGGTINGDGSLRVRVTATGEDTALAGIMRMVKEAQQSKSETQVLADRAAGWLFYVALGVAVITAIAWLIAVGFEVDVVARVATVLVIACPHALGLAVPLVVAITTAMGAQNGILVRDRLALEEARQIDVVMFDKTGTLTEGQSGVASIAPVEGWTEEDALALAAAVEADSEHTLARGIRRAAEVRGVEVPRVSDFEALKGRGVRAQRDGSTLHVGGPNLLEHLEVERPQSLDAFVQQAQGKGQTVVYLLQDHQVVSAFAMADLIRPESRQAVDRLKEM